MKGLATIVKNLISRPGRFARFPMTTKGMKYVGKGGLGLLGMELALHNIPEIGEALQTLAEKMGIIDAVKIVDENRAITGVIMRESVHHFFTGIRMELGQSKKSFKALVQLILFIKHSNIQSLEMSHDDDNASMMRDFEKTAGFAVIVAENTKMSSEEERELLQEIYLDDNVSVTPNQAPNSLPPGTSQNPSNKGPWYLPNLPFLSP